MPRSTLHLPGQRPSVASSSSSPGSPLPSRSHTTPAAVLLLVLVLGFVALGMWSTIARSTIPWNFDGTVTRIDVRPEKHPGVHDA